MKPSWKLTTAQKESLVREYVSGETQADLARKYGISTASVCLLLNERGIPRHSRRARGTVRFGEMIETIIPQLSVGELRAARQSIDEMLSEIGA